MIIKFKKKQAKKEENKFANLYKKIQKQHFCFIHVVLYKIIIKTMKHAAVIKKIKKIKKKKKIKKIKKNKKIKNKK